MSSRSRSVVSLSFGLVLTLANCADGPTQPSGPFRLTVLLPFGSTSSTAYNHLNQTYAYDIDPTGKAVGMAGVGTQWSKDGKPASLEANGMVLTVAYGVNAVGQVVGYGACGGGGNACMWEAGQLRNLGSLDYPGLSEPHAINDHGDAVGWAWAAPTGFDHAVLWRNGVATDLGTLGGLQSQALDIDNRGRVVGWARIAPPDTEHSYVPPRHAFLWENGAMSDLDALGGYENESIAFAINESRQVVGWATTVSGRRAFLWENDTLSFLPGSESSQAIDINKQGDVVGFYIVSGTTHHAALWRDGVRYDLNDLVGDPRVCLNWANAINEAGEIVGVGAWKSDGLEFAFRLTPTGPL